MTSTAKELGTYYIIKYIYYMWSGVVSFDGKLRLFKNVYPKSSTKKHLKKFNWVNKVDIKKRKKEKKPNSHQRR